MVRILCIHGTGSSADIFESQTSVLRSLLPNTWEWEFYDAAIECDADPTLKEMYPGPYFALTRMPTVSNMQEAHRWLSQLIEEEGPFDGFLGFSAGGLVPFSLMLARQIHKPLEPPLFRFMILMAGALPPTSHETDGIEITDWIYHRKPISSDIREIRRFNIWAAEHPELRPAAECQEGIHPALARLIEELSHGTAMRREDLYSRVYHPECVKERLRIPTLHILGQADDVYEAGRGMLALCDANTSLSFEHHGGHEIPRNRNDLIKVSALIEKTVARSNQLA